MAEPIDSLILDLLDWLARDERSYEQTMDAWRTSCPRLTVWEDANDRGLVRIHRREGVSFVRPTDIGLELLNRSRPNRAG
jgi:hypothetical protein